MGRIGVFAIVLLSAFITFSPNVDASPALHILSQQYTASADIIDFDLRHVLGGSGVSHLPISFIFEHPDFGAARGIADGLTGPSNGFLSAVAYRIGGFGGASADARMDFRPSETSILNLTTSGQWIGFAYSFIKLENLTDSTMMLYYDGVPQVPGFNDLTGSFFFTLDPSKDYRLSATAFTPPDAGNARVDYSVQPLPEPSSALLLLIGAAIVPLVRMR